MENLYLFHHITKFLENIIGGNVFLLCVISISICLKIFIAYFLISRAFKLSKINYSVILIAVFLVGSMFSDLAWIVTLTRRLFFPNMYYSCLIFSVRISWGFYIAQYQALALFVENFSDRKKRISFYQKIFLSISSIFILFFFALAFYDINCYDENMRSALEIKMQNISIVFITLYLSLTSLFVTLWKIRRKNIPKILSRQLNIFIKFIIFPIILADFIQYYPGLIKTTAANAYSVIVISSLLVTYSVFYCMRKIMGLRFLNLQNHVMATKRFDFIQDFKNIIDQFSQATDLKELRLITQYFFQEAFKVPSRRVRLHIRSLNKTMDDDWEHEVYNDKVKIEQFISINSVKSEISALFKNSKVIIADELEFSNFYENNKHQEELINFMNEISADIFIPIFEKEKVIAYIIVDKYARLGHKNKNETFYSDVERDQMGIFANYLANVIKHLQSTDFNILIKREKELKEELYLKHQEVSQYKESISSFLANANNEKVGALFYKNRRFTFGNQFAHELIPINLNTYSGHPITKKLKNLANQILEYGSAQSCMIEDKNGKKLAASGFLYVDKNSVVINVYYPEVSDILKQKLKLIKNPTKFDYLLYLETTKSGKLIDELIPGNGETLLNFKIDLLKVALSKKVTLLDLPEQDLLATVEILHHISLRENLHVLDIKKPSNDSNLAIKLFGINEIFGIKHDDKPLLEKLDKNGTLFIKNINNLAIETQKHLAEFIKYGFFRQYKGDKKLFSDVRIICSANVDLKLAVQQERFSTELFAQLSKKSLSMPSLISLSETDFEIITEELAKQAIKTDELQHILELTDKEKKKLTLSKPTSFFELKNKIKHILEKKSHKNKIVEEVQFVSSHELETSDPHIVEAARLGKHALRDRKVMSMLWNKFQNQNKIATLLGVNRSSVNRRCKEYNLI